MSKSLLDGDDLVCIDERGDDPMAGLSNLMDVMLVFACGLILALIGYYHVDISQSQDPSRMEAVQGSLSDAAQSIELSDDELTQLGMAYRDESTGQLYVLKPESDE